MNIDHKLFVHLTDAEKQHIGHLDAIFTSAGWNLLRQDLAEENEVVRLTIDNAPNWDAYNYARGCRDVYHYIMNSEGRAETEFTRRAEERATQESVIPMQDFL